MAHILIALLYWFHALATVVFLGHYVFLALIYLPVLSKTENGPAPREISKQSRPWMYTSMLAFIITGF